MIPSTHLSILNALKDSDYFEEAWGQFQERYEPLIQTWCRRQGLHQADAEDTTQEILTSLFQHLPRYEFDPERGRFRGYLRATVVNAVRNHFRWRKRKPFNMGTGGDIHQELLARLEDPAVVDELTAPIEERLDGELRKAAELVKTKLGEDAWLAFSSTIDEKRPILEVANELRMSIAAVYQKRHKVRSLLQEVLKQS